MHLVFGGELKSLSGVEFRDANAVDVVGLFADHARAVDAWREAAQRTVDDALMRYFIVPVHTPFDSGVAYPAAE
jgi:nitrate reductase alpha subunit